MGERDNIGHSAVLCHRREGAQLTHYAELKLGNQIKQALTEIFLTKLAPITVKSVSMTNDSSHRNGP